MKLHIVIASAAILGLAACGGGGSGGGPSASEGPPSDTGTASTAPSRADVQSANPAVTQRAANDAVANLPQFGSVTQSSNAGSVAGITGDAASASFDGRDVRVTISRADGTRLAFDSARHGISRETYIPVLPGYSYRGDGLLTHTDTSVSIAAVYINWNNSDPTDYLAGGYWAHLEGRTDPLEITGAEIGAFVDGPELSGAPTLPKLGTASYRGEAGGFYAYRSVEGSEIGEFTANATLTADFARSTISGCAGCDGGVAVSGVAESSTGVATEFFDVAVPARLRVGEASFGASGTFRNRNVTLERDDATIIQTSGSWGGRFSKIPDGVGDPRLVAGTAGAEWTESDGAKGTFVGAWYGTKN